MRKVTQQRLMAVSILLIFSLSSIAYVFSSFGTPATPVAGTLAAYVIDGEADPVVESNYIQNGYTFLKFYYNNNTSADIVGFVDQAPTTFTTSSGQIQMFVEKINNQKTYIKVININGENDIFNVTEDEIRSTLCANLLVLPTECALVGIDLSNFTGAQG